MALASAEAQNNLKKESQEVQARRSAPAQNRQGMPAYSIGTTSRPINRATSSKRSQS